LAVAFAELATGVGRVDDRHQAAAEIPLRLAHCRENPYALLSDWVPEPEPQKLLRHEVRRQLDLVAEVGAHKADERLSVELQPEARSRVEALLDHAGLEREADWLVVHPWSDRAVTAVPAGVLRARLSGAGARARGAIGVQQRRIRRTARGRAANQDAGAVAVAGRRARPRRARGASRRGAGARLRQQGAGASRSRGLTNPQHTPWGVPNVVLSTTSPAAGATRASARSVITCASAGSSRRPSFGTALQLLRGSDTVAEASPFGALGLA
jgi:hypothetical protein